MDLRMYVRALRKRWRIIAGVTLLVMSLAVVLTALTPKTYQASVQFFVSTSDTSDSAQLAQGGTFTQARVKSYTQLLTTPTVLNPVASETKFPGGASAIKPLVVSSVAPDTVLIDVAVTDTRPNRARAIATAIGKNFPGAVNSLESVSASKPSPVKVTVVQQPASTTPQVGPRWLTNLVLALALGLLLGCGLALLRDRLDTRIRTKEDVDETVPEMTILGSIPFDADASEHPLLIEADPQSARAEAFRSLRTNLQFVDVAEHPRVIVVTSSIAGEGKTTTTANLAFAIADSGSSVCLIEGDLRRPRLLEYLGLEGGVGLTDVLIGRAELRTVAQRFGQHRLMVVGAGATPPNPSELLGSGAMQDVLTDLKSRFDYVIIDAPPLLPVTDAAVLSTRAQGTVVVAGSGIVNREHLLTALDNLDAVHANILGLVVNRVPRSHRGGYYDYSYEYRTHEPILPTTTPDTEQEPSTPERETGHAGSDAIGTSAHGSRKAER